MVCLCLGQKVNVQTHPDYVPSIKIGEKKDQSQEAKQKRFERLQKRASSLVTEKSK